MHASLHSAQDAHRRACEAVSYTDRISHESLLLIQRTQARLKAAGKMV